jgi:hypothetical protein
MIRYDVVRVLKGVSMTEREGARFGQCQDLLQVDVM